VSHDPYTRKNDDYRSVGSNDRMETEAPQTDGYDRRFTLPARLRDRSNIRSVFTSAAQQSLINVATLPCATRNTENACEDKFAFLY